ncbi:MAG: polysaccharide deacetylase family protein [Candidatus Omnitrophica bacterium]|nr:polysaccharide deacetylase family protein [Candidatus Omnitrophota bacterium]
MKILMYHSVINAQSGTAPNRETGAHLYDIEEKTFEQHLQWLKVMGYQVATLSQPSLISKNQNVVITFDDGEMNNFEVAYPILKRFSYPAYFFVTVDRIGKKGYMDWPQLRELQMAGMIIGSHSLTHRILSELPQEELMQELCESKRILEENLKTKITTFSIPRGFISQTLMQCAEEAGYEWVFGSQPHHSQLAKYKGRIAVKANWSIQRFEQALKGYTPWKERAAVMIKNLIKCVAGNQGYDRFRSFLLRGRI